MDQVTPEQTTSREQLHELAQQLRVDSVRAAAAAGSGHPTSSMSAADLMAVLLAGHLRYDFAAPESAANDHLVFSKGHASPLLYSMYKLAGAIDDEELLTFREFGSRLQGHPTPEIPWVDVATGSLGQGLPISIGIALAGARLERADFRVWVLCGDSELAEGSMWEAFEHAGQRGPLQPDRDRRRQPARPARADDARMGHLLVGCPRRGLRLGRAGDRRPRPRGDRRRLRRGGRGRPAGGDLRPHEEGLRRRRGRGQGRLARQAARGSRGRGRGARRRPLAAGRGQGARGGAGPTRSHGRRSSGRPTRSARRSRPAAPTATPWPGSDRSTSASSLSTARSATRPTPNGSPPSTRTGSSRCTSPSSRWSPPRSACRPGAGSRSPPRSAPSSAAPTTSSGWRRSPTPT